MKNSVQSLWVGSELSELEILSIKSFQKVGHRFILYTYEKIKNIPSGTIVRDGNNIMKKKDLFKYKNSFLPFSDIFRYKMLYEKGGYWVDLDMIALKPLRFKEPYIFSSERTIQKGPYRNRTKTEIANIGILKAPPKSAFYKELFERCITEGEKGVKENIQFMRTMRNVLNEFGFEKYVKPAKMFCPLDWWHTKDAFMPICCKEKYAVKGYNIDSILNNSHTVHMWRSIMNKRHHIDLNQTFDQNSLWEKSKKIVISKNKKTKKRKNNFRKRSKKIVN